MALYPVTPAIEDTQQGIFVGWFGPIGVSAVCTSLFPSPLSLDTDRRGVTDYAMVALRELPEDRIHLRRVIVPVVLFIAFASTIAHVRSPLPSCTGYSHMHSIGNHDPADEVRTESSRSHKVFLLDCFQQCLFLLPTYPTLSNSISTSFSRSRSHDSQVFCSSFSF